jgi:hypothetical protein
MGYCGSEERSPDIVFAEGQRSWFARGVDQYANFAAPSVMMHGVGSAAFDEYSNA